MDLFDQLAEMNRPQVQKRSWMDEKHMELVTTLARLREVVDECIASKLYALDLETTGLDNRVFPGPEHGRTVERIAGYCISPDGVKGYYVPVRHRTAGGVMLDCNVNPREAAIEMKRLRESGAVAIFHHGKFDIEFLEFGEQEAVGNWDDPDSWEDTFILAYIRNTRERNKGLKHLAMQELGCDMIELEELFDAKQRKSGKLDFSLLDPTWEPCVWYGCSDAICTYNLFNVLHPGVVSPEPHGTSQKTIYQIEKMCLPATRWMERCRIFIDRTKIEDLIRLGQSEWFDSLEEVYEEAGKILGRSLQPGWYRLMRGLVPGEESYRFDPAEMKPTYMEVREEAIKRSDSLRLDPVEVASTGKNRVQTLRKDVPSLVNAKKKESVDFPLVYDVTIPTEIGLLLRELGVQGLVATEKSGQVKTSKDVLDMVIDRAGDQFPFMGKIKRFRETAKALGTNLFPIYLDTAPDRAPDGCIKVGFNAHKVDTGRFSTPQPRDKMFNGQVRWNLHSIPATYDKNKPACMLRIRECIRARPGKILFAIDYSGVELRIVTNLSREPLWLAEFFRCSECENVFDRGERGVTPPAPPPFCPKCGSDKIGDLHSLTAIAVYGQEIVGTKEFKGKRQKAKGLNFAMCYGGGGSAAQRSVGVDKDEGWRIKRQFDATYNGLRAWWTTQHNFAKKYKYVTTMFGRRYPLPDIDHEMRGFQEKAKRNAVNGPVQGTSADIMKLAMALLYKEFKKRGWLTKILMTITIHDELIFEIDDDIAEEAVEVINHIMTITTVKNLKAPIPLKVDIEFGYDWTVPYNLTEMRWNKAKPGSWTPRWAAVFPKAYAEYLSRGGEPVEGAPTPPSTPPAGDSGGGEPAKPSDTGVSPGTPAVPTAGQLDFPKGGKGELYTHTIPSTKLTYGVMDSIARIIAECHGGGTQPLRVQTERGEVLWDDPTANISSSQFYVLSKHHGVYWPEGIA